MIILVLVGELIDKIESMGLGKKLLGFAHGNIPLCLVLFLSLICPQDVGFLPFNMWTLGSMLKLNVGSIGFLL